MTAGEEAQPYDAPSVMRGRVTDRPHTELDEPVQDFSSDVEVTVRALDQLPDDRILVGERVV